MSKTLEQLAKEHGIRISKPSLNLGQGMVVEPMYYHQLEAFAKAYQAAIPQQKIPANFDEWMKNPYTIALQKSIQEDYVPKNDAQQAIPSDGQVYLSQNQADYLKVKLASTIKSWTHELVSKDKFIELQNDYIQSFVLSASPTAPIERDK
jgi:uncharacterized NAD(P)/FAD-binding protein YdhS